MHNGVLVPENSGSVTIDKNAEKITYFRIEFDENVMFDSNESIISNTDAEKAFSDKLGLKMEYNSKYDKDTISAFPVYKFNSTDKKISAIDGSVIKPNRYYYRDMVTNGAMKEESMMDSAAGLTKAELENLELISGLISKDEGVLKIYENEYVAIDDSYELSDFYTYKVYGKKDEYTGSFEFRNKEKGKYASVTLNLNSGEILSFYVPEIKSEKQKMTGSYKNVVVTNPEGVIGDITLSGYFELNDRPQSGTVTLRNGGYFDECAKVIQDEFLVNAATWRMFVDQFRYEGDAKTLAWRGEYTKFMNLDNRG